MSTNHLKHLHSAGDGSTLVMPLLPVCRLENHYMPNAQDIIEAARQTLEFA